MKKLYASAIMAFLYCMMVSCSDDILVGEEWIDPDFAQALQQIGYIEDAKTVTPHDVEGLDEIVVLNANDEFVKLKSLRGIEYFKSLKTLMCGYNNLTSLDLSGNPLLENLDCTCNDLSSINLSKNTKLVGFFAGFNQLATIDLSQCNNLRWFSCRKNKLSSLNLHGLEKLDMLNCSENELTELDISQNPKIMDLECYSNPGLNHRFVIKVWFDPEKEWHNIRHSDGYWYGDEYWPYHGKYVYVEFEKGE